MSISPAPKWPVLAILINSNSIKGMSYSTKMLTDINVHIMKASEVKVMFYLQCSYSKATKLS